jgi:EAL domain-containing protein (putative c-di-GMP-specific phosphodiesterase class I)
MAQDNERFLERMDQELSGWGDPEARLRGALHNNELQLLIQPIAALAEMRYVMAEVLVRLREEEEAMLPPGEFLPVFEQYGMMPELDRWVVEQSLRRLAARAGAGFRQLSINVSRQSIVRAELPQFVAKCLASLSVRPDALCFEVAEDEALHTVEDTALFAVEMRRLGCKVAIDGFGRRAASFAPLKSVRCDYLKVDGSITRNVLRSDLAVRKLQAIVRVGEALGIGIIAEFVEETDILAKLRALGVGYAQGFGIARPAPIDGP